MAELDGAIAIVTGAGRGFGRAIAERLARAGAAVTLTSRSETELRAVADAIHAAGGRAEVVAGDVTVAADVERVVAETTRRSGAPTHLVHAAGIPGPFGPVWELDPEALWRTLDVNVRSAFLYARAVLPSMIGRGSGRILNIASRAGLRAVENVCAYSLSKATLMRFTEHIAVDARAHGVHAFAVDPGTVFTQLAADTVAAEDARRWAPGFVAMLEKLRTEADPSVGLGRCAELCLALCAGRHDALSGRMVSVDDKLSV